MARWGLYSVTTGDLAVRIKFKSFNSGNCYGSSFISETHRKTHYDRVNSLLGKFERIVPASIIFYRKPTVEEFFRMWKITNRSNMVYDFEFDLAKNEGTYNVNYKFISNEYEFDPKHLKLFHIDVMFDTIRLK